MINQAIRDNSDEFICKNMIKKKFTNNEPLSMEDIKTNVRLMVRNYAKCGNCNWMSGESDEKEKILCSCPGKAVEEDIILDNTIRSMEFINEGNIDILKPHLFGERCEYFEYLGDK